MNIPFGLIHIAPTPWHNGEEEYKWSASVKFDRDVPGEGLRYSDGSQAMLGGTVYHGKTPEEAIIKLVKSVEMRMYLDIIEKEGKKAYEDFTADTVGGPGLHREQDQVLGEGGKDREAEGSPGQTQQEGSPVAQ